MEYAGLEVLSALPLMKVQLVVKVICQNIASISSAPPQSLVLLILTAGELISVTLACAQFVPQ
jgi:hypothetical protein